MIDRRQILTTTAAAAAFFAVPKAVLAEPEKEYVSRVLHKNLEDYLSGMQPWTNNSFPIHDEVARKVTDKIIGFGFLQRENVIEGPAIQYNNLKSRVYHTDFSVEMYADLRCVISPEEVMDYLTFTTAQGILTELLQENYRVHTLVVPIRTVDMETYQPKLGFKGRFLLPT